MGKERAWLVGAMLVGLAGCDPMPAVPDVPSVDGGGDAPPTMDAPVGEDVPPDDDAGTDAPSGCDDGIACTEDERVGASCENRPSHRLCADDEICSVTSGCVASPVCADEAACADDDPCTTERCDGATAVCVHELRDNDDDGQAPVVCGGTDCNDADEDVGAGVTEVCNTIDDDCDGAVDDGFDLDSDLANCGACGVACGGLEACVDGDCVDCGNVGLACCAPGGAGECPLGGRCDTTTGVCGPICGSRFEPCCEGASPCDDAADICADWGTCSPRTACGDDTCDLVRTGCGEGETCRYIPPSGGAPGDYVCEPHRGSDGPPYDATCATNVDCFNGFECVEGRCEYLCCPRTPEDELEGRADGCGGGLRCAARAGTPTGHCDPMCDPIADTGCSSLETCRPYDDGASCFSEGSSGATGAPCGAGNDCDAGHACVCEMPDGCFGRTAVCRQVCLLGADGCPSGQTCTRIPYVGLHSDFGFCR